MFRSKSAAFFSLLIIMATTAVSWAVTIPVQPYVEVSIATAGPLSLSCAPDGGAYPFSEAFDQSGNLVDGTITLILYDDMPPYGNPVPFYPREDIWLMDLSGSLVSCPGGTIADQDTDANGMTYWANPLLVGGHVDPAAGNQLAIMVSGWILEKVELADFRVNSCDLNGDLQVNLTDVVLFTHDYFGVYDYASDFFWDGVINLSDIVLLARSYQTQCP